MKSLVTDVVVIGAGIAGVAAASGISKQFSTIVLESTPRFGGRIYSPRIASHRCELGATVGYNQQKYEIDAVPTDMISETGEMGIRFRGITAFGRKPEDCLRDAANAMQWPRLADLPELVDAIAAGHVHPHRVEDEPEWRTALAGLFNVMNPGDVLDYRPELWSQALHRFYPSHRVGGNIELVDFYADGVDVRTGHRVEHISRSAGHFRIEGNCFECSARALVIATDAANAADLLRDLDPQLAQALETIEYGAFVVHAAEVASGMGVDSHTYMVDIDAGTSVTVQLHTPDPRITHRLTLFSGQLGRRLLEASEQEIADRARLSWEDFPGRAKGEILGERLARWPRAGTVIGPGLETLMQGIAASGSRARGLFLAGDYVVSPHYGMAAAARSGRRAAESVQRMLSKQASNV